MIVAIVGSIHMDFYIRLPKLPVPGETVLGHGFTMLPGGKGANQAVACSRLGAYTYMVGRVGNDIFGEKLIENFRKNNVDTKYMEVDKTTHTGIAFILLDEKTGENMITVAPGADYNVSAKDVDNAMDAISRSDILLLQLEIPIDTVVYAAKRAWEKGVRVILNPAPAASLPDEIYRYIHVLTPNRVEASLLTNINIESREDAVKAGKLLIDKGVDYVIITLGAEGSMVISKDFVRHIPAYKVEVVDTTGAGDAFNAALAVSLAEGKDIVEACRIANAAAALQITKLGAQSGLPTREELEEFLRKHRQ
ncbi:MAG: ribokinase [Desulfurococcales archaeon]|nr:ribokinase [Desulfurococcales archaeon]